MSVVEKIRTRGFWEVIIRPSRFSENRVPDISSLYPILEKSSVSIRGWNFPHFNPRERPHIDIDWIGQEFEWQHMLSSWRFYQSGLFVHVSGMPIDWRDQSGFWPSDKNWKQGKWLGVSDTVATFTEIFELVTRLSLTDVGDDSMFVGIKLINIKDRTLIIEDPHKWGFFQNYTASLNEFPFSKELSKSELIAKPWDYALEASNELFKRFGWETTTEVLRSFQKDFLRS